ncbi:hypothetical protein HJ01_02007 [Flavobacterium frigoris PS1]|uniref:Uncharacterized protein n=1 Tax=Flavobacterium frigoris (strain PS1) TaxID=1086011 RepID=H7FSK9_FLAFP|nr:hypothetical protein HJ01_02007 [Flavobacterium frigoris PS1]
MPKKEGKLILEGLSWYGSWTLTKHIKKIEFLIISKIA